LNKEKRHSIVSET